ncbi:MAG: TonB-dependent receptor [Thermoanaerobaculia bacterium]
MKLHQSAWIAVLGLAAAAISQNSLAAEAAVRTDASDAASSANAAVDTPSSDLPSFFASTTVTAVGREVDVFEVTTPVTVVPAKEIERQMPQNAADLLRTQPGVDVNGVGPNQARPVIRGLRGLRVLFLEDGLRLNNARRQTDFGEITGIASVDDAAAVEVVRGPASVLYGSDAVGGVLNLVTRPPSFGDGRHHAAEVDGRYDQAGDSWRGHLGLAGALGENWRFSLSAMRREASDYQAPSGDYGDIHLDDSVRVTDSGVKDDDLSALLAWNPRPDQQLVLRHHRYRADRSGFGRVDPERIGDTSGVDVRILYPFQDFDRTTLSWDATLAGAAVADSVQTRLYHQDNTRALVNDIDINIGPIAPHFPDSEVHALTRNWSDLETWGLRSEAIKGLAAENMLTYGAEIYRDDSTNTDHGTTTTSIRFPFPPFEIQQVDTNDRPNAPNAKNTSWGVFVQDEIPFARRFKATAGLRYQKVSTKADPTTGWDISGLDFSDSKLVGSATLLYQATDYLNFLASWGSAFRSPNIIERLFNGPTPEGTGFQILNADLVSEDSKNIDLGMKYRRADAYFELVYFKNRISNAIIQATLSPEEIAALPAETQQAIEASGAQVVVQQRNEDRLRIEGVELALGYRLALGLELGGNYTHLSGRRQGISAAPVDDLYSDKWNLFARYNPTGSRFWLEYRVRHNASTDVVLSANELPPPVGTTLPGFTVHDLGGGVTLFDNGAQRHSLTLRLENATDELYAEFSNATFFRPEPARRLVAAYRVNF